MEFELKRGGHADLKRIYPAMEYDFRRWERSPELLLHKALLEKKAELLLLRDENKMEHGYAVTLTASGRGYVLGSWLAIYPTLRGEGAGKAFLELIFERYRDKRGIIIEVESGNEELLRLYTGMGFVPLNVPYSLFGHPYILMIKTNGTPELLPQTALEPMLNDFYAPLLPGFIRKMMIKF